MCYGGCDCQRCNPPEEPVTRTSKTDDLRQACEALLESIDNNKLDMRKVDTLMAFARAQQAKGIREAMQALDARRLHYAETRHVDTLIRGIQLNEVHGCLEALKAQATAREAIK